MEIAGIPESAAEYWKMLQDDPKEGASKMDQDRESKKVHTMQPDVVLKTTFL